MKLVRDEHLAHPYFSIEVFMARWMIAGKKCDFKQIGDNLGVDQVVVRIMRNRDMIDEREMSAFLKADERCYHSYESMKN